MLHPYDLDRILMTGERSICSSGRVHNMYRVIAIIGGALALAACSSTSDLGDMFKPAPSMDTVRFESEPPGAEAKASSGQTCRTPCALALPTAGPLTVTFALNGYQTATENLEVLQNTGSPPALTPNPVVVELTPAPPAAAKKPARKRPAAAKPAAAKKPAAKKPAAASAPASAPAPAPAAQQQSPWPATPPAR
jgi:hypothetical protein